MQKESPISFKTLLFCILASGIIVSYLLISNLLNKQTTVVFCNVGEGSAVYIRAFNSTDILINAGPDKKILACLGSHMPFFDRDIEYIVFTSASQSYVAGLSTLLNRYRLHKIYIPDNFEGTKNNQLLVQFFRTHNISTIPISNVSNLSISGASLKLVNIHGFTAALFSQPQFEIYLLSTVPGRILSKTTLSDLDIEENIYLLQLPVFGFKKDLKDNILSLANTSYTVINKQSKAVNENSLKIITTQLEALKESYSISNADKDLVYELN